MRTRLSFLFSILVLVSFLFSSMSVNARGRHRGQRMEAMDKLRTVRLLELVQALDLDEKTGIKLAATLKRNDKKRRALHFKAKKALDALEEETGKDKPSDKRLGDLVNELWNIRSDMKAVEEQEFKELRTFLTPLQQAKYILAMRRFMHRMRSMMREREEFMKRRQKMRGPHEPMPPDMDSGPPQEW